jgi:hypothetical protein
LLEAAKKRSGSGVTNLSSQGNPMFINQLGQILNPDSKLRSLLPVIYEQDRFLGYDLDENPRINDRGQW